ncbi:MAG TPA: phytoene desaturase family protein [Acidimicrobiia bacterium]|nr:phytoene desaturase family protein [Acidimicrobiia bacterium]
MRTVVVGAGLGGLSAACHLAGRGHEVVVVDRESVPGGRAGVVEEGGFRIDSGPTVLTMVGLLEQTFAAAGAGLDDHLTLRRLDPTYRACFPDGSVLRVRPDRDAMVEEIRTFAGAGEAAAFERFCSWLGRVYRLELPHFIDRNYDSPLDLARDPMALVRLVRLGGLRKLAPTVAGFFRDERLQRIFSFQSMYAGLSPFEALAIYSVITYMDMVEGVYFPEGGMHEVPRALTNAAEKAGATFQFATPVERITRHADGSVQGVRLSSGELIAADAVVCNVDVAVAYRSLLGLSAPSVAGRGRYSPSCIVWLAGVRGTLPVGAAHHNIHFGSSWREAFTALFADGRRMPDPSILVTSATASDPSLAPDGATTLFALEPAPNLDGSVDWASERPRLRDELANRVGALGYPVDDVVVERLTDPRDWEAQGLERGTPFALAHRFFQTGPFRPGNVDRRIPGLVFTGMGTVPGVGIPMVLISGRLAADRVDEWAERRGRP